MSAPQHPPPTSGKPAGQQQANSSTSTPVFCSDGCTGLVCVYGRPLDACWCRVEGPLWGSHFPVSFIVHMQARGKKSLRPSSKALTQFPLPLLTTTEHTSHSVLPSDLACGEVAGAGMGGARSAVCGAAHTHCPWVWVTAAPCGPPSPGPIPTLRNFSGLPGLTVNSATQTLTTTGLPSSRGSKMA